MRWLLLSALITVVSYPVIAQDASFTGTVVDMATHKPIPQAHVFFANTSLGEITDANGFFKIKGIPRGKYDLVISCVGYETFHQAIDFTQEPNQSVDVALREASVKLNEVFVNADTAGWNKNFQEFKRYFLGETRNASYCVIKNPRDIMLYFDHQERILVAYAKKPIEIENLALGYQLFYVLYTFEMDFKRGRLVNIGIPRFVELIPKSESERKQWNKERERAYRGSFMHFMRAFKNNSFVSEGFTVREIYKTRNPDRPDQQWLDNRITYWLAQRGEGRERKESTQVSKPTTRSVDSLGHYYKMNSMPRELDRNGTLVLDSRPFFINNRLLYKGVLSVTYKSEKEEPMYVKMMGNKSATMQASSVHLFDEVHIYPNGYYEDVRNIFLEGYLAWAEKIAELLPLEYQLHHKK